MARTLILYRSNDPQASATAERLQSDLVRTFGIENISLNFERKPNPGDIVLVVINENWVTAQTPSGQRRLEDPNDLIRLQLDAALQVQATIIPILLNYTPTINPNQLPHSLRDFATLQALHLREDSNWASDLTQLVVEINRYQPDDDYLLDDVLREPPKPILPPAMPAPATPPGSLDDYFGGEIPTSESESLRRAQQVTPLPPSEPPLPAPPPAIPAPVTPPKPERKKAEDTTKEIRFGQDRGLADEESPIELEEDKPDASRGEFPAQTASTSRQRGFNIPLPDLDWRGAPQASPPSAAARWSLSAAEYLQQMQNPTFSAYYPASIQPAQAYTLLAYVHIAVAEGLVAQDAGQYRALMGGTQSSSSAPSRVALAKSEVITFVPRIEGLTFTPAEQTLQWDYQQDFIKAAFLFTAPTQLTQPLTGVIQVYKGVFIAGELPIQMAIQVAPSEVSPPHQARYHAFDPVFASYSHRDTPVMEFFRQQRAQLGQKLWVDIYDLRSGEHWNARLLEMIEQSAAVQLFWSDHSAQSAYCRQEWQHALQVGQERPRFIQPVWWESPMPPPPDELAHLHFQKIELPLQTRAQVWGKRVKGWLGRGGT